MGGGGGEGGQGGGGGLFTESARQPGKQTHRLQPDSYPFSYLRRLSLTRPRLGQCSGWKCHARSGEEESSAGLPLVS